MEEVVTIANSYYERGNYHQALKLLEPIQLNLYDRDHQEAFILLARIYCNEIDDKKGIQIIRDLLQHYPNDSYIIDVSLEIFSSYSDLASEVEKLAKEMIGRYPDNDYYFYILSYVGFNWLKMEKEQVLDYLNNALTLSNYSNYLDFGYEVFSKYGSGDERSNCLELMISNDPQSYETRKCLLNDFLRNKDYESFLESALDLVKEYPNNVWLIEEIDDVKDILYGNFLDLFVLRCCEKIGAIQESFNNPVVYFINVYVFSSLIFAFCIVLIPFFLVTIMIVGDYKHFNLCKNDKLYRRLIVASESFKLFKSSALFSLTLNSNKYSKLYLTSSEIVLAKKIKGNINYLEEDEVIPALSGKKTIKISDIEEVVISDYNLEINLIDGNYETFDIGSPEMILAIEDWLKNSSWVYSASYVQSFLKIIFNSLILVGLGIYAYSVGVLNNWNIYLVLYISSAFLFNGLYFLWFRLNNRLSFKYYIPYRAALVS